METLPARIPLRVATWPGWAQAGAGVLFVWAVVLASMGAVGYEWLAVPEWLELPLVYPTALTADDAGTLYVYLPLFHHVQVYDADGRFQRVYQQRKAERRGGPAHLLLDREGQPYFAYGTAGDLRAHDPRRHTDARGRTYRIGWRYGLPVIERTGATPPATVWGAWWWYPFLPLTWPGALVGLLMVAVNERLPGRAGRRTLRKTPESHA